MIDNNDIKKLKTIFATKKDLKNFATKSELMSGLRNLENKIELSNEKFKVTELDCFKTEAGRHVFTMPSQKWIRETNIIGIISEYWNSNSI